jgi:hypothetical protein
MRTWLLLALLGLVLLVSMTYREGLINPPAPQCTNGGTLTGNTCSSVNGVPGNPVCASGYSYRAVTGGNGRCVQTATESIGSYGYNAAGQINSTSEIGTCNIYWDAAITSWAAGNAAASDASSTCLQYAPSWVAALSSTGNLLDSAGKPTAATKAQAIIEKQQDTDYDAQQTEAAGYAASTGYAAVEAAALAGASGGQSLTAPIDESPDSDIGAVRPTGGTVFSGPNSPYTNQSGTGQGSAAAAAAGVSGGNTYGSGAGYSSSTVAGNTGLTNGLTVIKPATNMDLQVGGPKYGGLGAPIASSSSGSYETGPVLYGPKAAQNKNIDTANWTPSYWSVGSDFLNMFAGTSRSPGDQDLIPNPYLQSSAYSLANGSQKTNPVPFLADFSAFQS